MAILFIKEIDRLHGLCSSSNFMISTSSCICTLPSVRWREVEKPRESYMCPRFCGWNWKLIVWLITIRSSGSLKGEPRIHGFSLSVCNSSCLDTGSWIIYWSTAPDIIPGISRWHVNSGSKEAPSLTRQFVNIICWFKWKRRKCGVTVYYRDLQKTDV